MNPMTNVKNIKKLSEQDIKLGGKSSWHDQYKDSAWIFVGGLPYDLTEGDIICVFSQYGEIVNINLVRDRESGKQKGFCFLCYEDQRSTNLAVDNLNSIKILGRTLRVDHVENYKVPKESKKNPIDDETRKIIEDGCAPGTSAAQSSTTKQPPAIKMEKIEEVIVGGVRLPPRLPIGPIKTEKVESEENENKTSKKKKKKDKKKKKKGKKEKKSSKRKRKHSTNSSSDSNKSSSSSESDQSDGDTGRKIKKKRQ